MERRLFLRRVAAVTGGTAWLSRMSSGDPLSVSSSVKATLPIEFGSEKQVFVDWEFIDPGAGLNHELNRSVEASFQPRFMPYGVKLSVISPVVQAEPIIIPDTPADGVFVEKWCTLMKDEGKYRLWYETFERIEDSFNGLDSPNYICYAESEDGRQWTKPKLGLVEFQGSRQNNIVYSAGDGSTVFKDPSAVKQERYKLIYIGGAPSGEMIPQWVFGAVSPDGLHWTRLEQPVLKHGSDTQSVVAYDEQLERYVMYVRGWEPSFRSGYGGRRLVKRTESTDFRNFPKPETVLATGSDDPPDMDIYSNAYQRWPGASRAHIMLPALYHHSADTVDVHLAVSRDGRSWSRPSKSPLIPVGSEGSGFEGMVFAGVGTVPLGSGVWAFPVFRTDLTHNMQYPQFVKGRIGSLWLATVREDGFMALESESLGECWTQQSTFKGSQLLVNSWATRGGRLLAEIAMPDGAPVPGFALQDCDGLEGDVLWLPLRWKGRSDISALAGRPVRIRFHLTRCRLHAFRFS